MLNNGWIYLKEYLNKQQKQVGKLNNLDQFYTKPETAQKCWNKFLPIVEKLTNSKSLFFIEPSAGDGAFYDLLPINKRVGMDVCPRHKYVVKRDFLQCRYCSPADAKHTAAIGNPPFGKRGKLAVDFVNKAFVMADTVAFIVPVIFRKYFIHKQIAANARLIYSITLPPCSFRTISKEDHCVNTEFQIWTKLPSRHKNKRLFLPPPISHPHFIMWQYNNTKQALKMFDNPFDFGVPCQGYQDYARREFNAEKCEKHKQWILFKAKNKTVRKRLYDGIDYKALSIKHVTSIPGFRKGDVVQEYMRIYG